MSKQQNDLQGRFVIDSEGPSCSGEAITLVNGFRTQCRGQERILEFKPEIAVDAARRPLQSARAHFVALTAFQERLGPFQARQYYPEVG